MTFAIRDMADVDVPALDAVLGSAYETTVSFEASLRTSLASGAARTFVADDGEPVGMATLHDYGSMGYVSFVGVVPAHQSRGIGRRLMEAVIAESERRGHRALALEASEQGQLLYRTMGFEEIGTTVTFEGSGRIAEHATASAVRRAIPGDCEAVCACDSRAFAGDRSATLAPWFARDDYGIFVGPATGGVEGFAVVRDGRVSPWIASSPDIAAALFDAVRLQLRATTGRVSVPADNPPALQIVQRCGWTERMRHAHMVRGVPLRFPRSGIYGLISLGEG